MMNRAVLVGRIVRDPELRRQQAECQLYPSL